MKARTILTAASAIVILFTANTFANDKTPSKTPEQNEVKKVESVKVKNIWKDLPSYDRYGNLITAKARYNMEQNRLNTKKENNKSNNNLTQEIK